MFADAPLMVLLESCYERVLRWQLLSSFLLGLCSSAPRQQNITHFRGLLKGRFSSPLQFFAKTTWPQAHHNHQYACFLAWMPVFSIPVRAGFLVSCPYPMSCLCVLSRAWVLLSVDLMTNETLVGMLFHDWKSSSHDSDCTCLAQRLVASTRIYCG